MPLHAWTDAHCAEGGPSGLGKIVAQSGWVESGVLVRQSSHAPMDYGPLESWGCTSNSGYSAGMLSVGIWTWTLCTVTQILVQLDK